MKFLYLFLRHHLKAKNIKTVDYSRKSRKLYCLLYDTQVLEIDNNAFYICFVKIVIYEINTLQLYPYLAKTIFLNGANNFILNFYQNIRFKILRVNESAYKIRRLWWDEITRPSNLVCRMFWCSMSSWYIFNINVAKGIEHVVFAFSSPSPQKSFRELICKKN